MKAVVTGASGFIGRAVIARLTLEGWEICPVTRGEIDAFLQELPGKKVDVIFHLAGLTQSREAALLYEANTVLTARLLDAVDRMEQPPRIVLAGSAAEYGPVSQQAVPVAEDHPCNPLTDYAVSKYAQSLMALSRAAAGANLVVARIWNPVGPGMPLHLALAGFAAQITAMPKRGGVLHVGNLEVERDFIDVVEAARILIELGRHKAARGKIANVCSGQVWRLGDLVNSMIYLSSRVITVKVDQSRLRPGETIRLFGATTRLRELGITPVAPDFATLLPNILGAA